MTETFIVICREDRQSDGGRGDYSLATRTVFRSKEDADAYAAGISSSREPLVIGGRFAELRFNDGRFSL